jgi:toxin ParE1/3/4
LIVPKIDFTAEAEVDLDHIAAFTKANWGWRQTHKYLAQLEDGISLIAQNPSIGRLCAEIRAGVCRFEIGHHVIFYTARDRGILIIRILHENMLPSKYI